MFVSVERCLQTKNHCRWVAKIKVEPSAFTISGLIDKVYIKGGTEEILYEYDNSWHKESTLVFSLT